MPVEFDPEWEYYSGDPEVQELLDEASGELKDYDDRRARKFGAKAGWKVGFIACMDPNNPNTRLGRERIVKDRGRPKTLVNVICDGCGNLFSPDRSSRVYCSVECVPHRGKPRQLTDAECPTCRRTFPKLRSCHRFCSRRCGGMTGGQELTRPAPVIRNACELYASGVNVEDLCDQFGITPPTLRRWCRVLGVAVRKPGHPKEKQCTSQPAM